MSKGGHFATVSADTTAISAATTASNFTASSLASDFTNSSIVFMLLMLLVNYIKTFATTATFNISASLQLLLQWFYNSSAIFYNSISINGNCQRPTMEIIFVALLLATWTGDN